MSIEKVTDLIEELSLGKLADHIPSVHTNPRTWDSVLSHRHESLLLDAGFTYSPLSMEILHGTDREGWKWIARIPDGTERGPLSQAIIFYLATERGTTLRHGPIYTNEFKGKFG
jgi:hypothetical protein